MKKIFFLLVFLAPSLADAADEVRVVYPSQAAEVELDSSTPAKRAEPPVREASELDPVTPLGQIQSVLKSLERLETAQEEFRSELRKTTDDDALVAKLGAKLPTRERFDSLFPLLEKNADDGEKVRDDVATLLKTTDGIGAKLDALAKTTENLRATVEAAQKTAASIERIRTSRWTDYAVIAIFALVLLQLLGKVGAFIVSQVSATRSRFAELSEAYALAKEELEKKKAKEAKAK